jgi:hypothetical protein
MTTEPEKAVSWDDELEQLSTRAAAILGEEFVSVAVEQLFARMRADETTVSFAQFGPALKTELRRLVRPH